MDGKITLKDFEQAVINLNNLAIQMWNEAVEEDRAEQLLRDLENDPELKVVYNALAQFNV